MIRVGTRNAITDVPGIAVGNAEDDAARTGVTVVVPAAPPVCAADVRGGAPGTRETDALDPSCLVDRVDAVMLSGGSAFGLDGAAGVVAWLAERGRGFPAGPARVPIVPAAILFDLANGGDKGWQEPPYRELARRACDAASGDLQLGNVGAGLGATAGPLKGGLGSASFVAPVGDRTVTVGALAAVNSFGAVTMPDSPVFWAWPLEQDGEFGGPFPPEQFRPAPPEIAVSGAFAANTTLVVVATDAALTKADARRVAIMAHDGLARAIRPAHTPFDGDTVFVLATGGVTLARRPDDLALIGALAADTVARAIARGVCEARSLGTSRCYREVYASP